MSPRELAALKTQSKPVGILTLAQQIGALHRDIEGRNEEMFELLTQAKKDAGEDGWLKWLATNREVLGFGERQAQRYLREPDARVSDAERHAQGEKKRRAAVKDSKLQVASPDLVPDDEDGVEPEVLPEIEPPATKQNTKAPANEQPAPKKFKPGSRGWVEEQIDTICGAAYNLQNLYPKLTGGQQEQIQQAQKALEHVVRIGANFAQVDQVSRELVQLWNQQGSEQVEVYGYLIRRVKETVANMPYISAWKQLIEKIYAAQGSSWFTSEHFDGLLEISDVSEFESLEKEWAPAAPESVEVSPSKVMPALVGAP